ncbi:uncharacterized protein LOC129601230 [Paramacrobiotus metropolitanus]|uniref:uncharacterized protein LOC129601230 n=1 Tax=Paramacrobiotus metropolitanus TaxID=2943436 RepID=UPI002446554B|nr:uncharacterized protein LOC129601230 [Paramacrobiotus metropolitanus]
MATLADIYLDASNPGSLGGIERLYREAQNHGFSRQQVEEYLQIEAYFWTLIMDDYQLTDVDRMDIDAIFDEGSWNLPPSPPYVITDADRQDTDAILAACDWDDWALEEISDIPDFSALFSLTKNKERKFKKFNSTEYEYRVEIAALPLRVPNNYCLPAALYLGKYRLTHDVQERTKASGNICTVKGINKLTSHAREIIQLADLPLGRCYDLNDLSSLQHECFPEFQVKVISADHEVEVKKGDFPHHFNRPENWDKVLPWPEPEMYVFDGLKKKDKEEFLKWYAEAKACGWQFDFRAEIMAYCSNDVTVLRRCALKFVDDFVALTNLNPLDSITMSSACNRYYRTFHLEPEKLAVLSSHGPHRNRRTSVQATQWLEMLNRDLGGRIQHGRNGKEVHIGPYYVDGYDAATRTVYEYNGCVFHGHPECTEEEDRSPFSRKKMSEVYEEYLDRVRYLEDEKYTVVTKWECEWKRERKDTDIATFLSGQNLREPLNPRDAFKGGRTNASRLYYAVKPGEMIMHFDVVSLYPFVNKTKTYPIGHPTIILSDFKDVKEYYGLVSCKILPPPQCLYPVLPATINKKLVFALCRTCADTKYNDYCRHSDADRCIEGVWTTPELHHAIDRGYTVQEVYEVWHWDTLEAGVYAAYINKFLKIKMEASGWPSWCKTNQQKDDFIRQVKEREGSTLIRKP